MVDRVRDRSIANRKMQIKDPSLIEAIEEAIDIIENESIGDFRFDRDAGVTPEQFLAKMIWGEIINRMDGVTASFPIGEETCQRWFYECIDDNLPEAPTVDNRVM